MSGFFAVLYDSAKAEEGPIETGIGRYSDSEDAKDEARDWSVMEGIPLDFVTGKN